MPPLNYNLKPPQIPLAPQVRFINEKQRLHDAMKETDVRVQVGAFHWHSHAFPWHSHAFHSAPPPIHTQAAAHHPPAQDTTAATREVFAERAQLTQVIALPLGTTCPLY